MQTNLYFKNGKLRKQPKKVKLEPEPEPEGCYGEKVPNSEAKYGQKCAQQYEPPLPVSVIKEIPQSKYNHNPEQIYNAQYLEKKIDYEGRKGSAMYEPPLPTTIVTEEDKPNISMTEKPYESTCEIFNADCLDKMKDLPDKSVDLIFCDLPYGQTSCAWDSLIDLELFWKQVMRIKKLNTPIFFTTTTKFGVSLIQSAPKKCHFRYDLVWVKSAPAGFLCAKKMPMRKHEMIYVFYEKLPFYDLSSHQHKFLNKVNSDPTRENKSICYGEGDSARGVKYTEEYREKHGKKEYDPPLPVSVVTDEKYERKNSLYPNRSKNGETAKSYDPPLPVSIVTDEKHLYKTECVTAYGKATHHSYRDTVYDPPLPNSMLEIKSTRGKHSTEKPVALMSWILKYYSKEGDMVLDPTMGSGSTGVACKDMNRNFIGIEMDKDIFKVAQGRLE